MSVFCNERAHKLRILSNSHVLTALTCVFPLLYLVCIFLWFFLSFCLSLLHNDITYFFFVLIFQFEFLNFETIRNILHKYQTITMSLILCDGNAHYELLIFVRSFFSVSVSHLIKQCTNWWVNDNNANQLPATIVQIGFRCSGFFCISIDTIRMYSFDFSRASRARVDFKLIKRPSNGTRLAGGG